MEHRPPGPRPVTGWGGERTHLTRSLFLAMFGTVLALILLLTLWKLRPLLILLFVSLLIACSLSGPASRLAKLGIKKSLAVVGMYLLVAAAIGLFGWFAGPALVGQASQAVDKLPEQVDRLEKVQERLHDVGTKYPALSGLDTHIQQLAARGGAKIGQLILNLPSLMAEGILVVTSILTLSLLMVVSWEKIKPALLELIHPENRELAERVMTEIGGRLGAYLRAKAIMMTIIGAWVYATFFFMHIPFAVLAAIVAAAFEIVPRIGPLFARAVLIVFALPLGWVPAVVVLISHTIISEIKGSWLSPVVEGKQLDIHPMTALIAVLAGAMLLGWMGALIAVPAAASLQVVFEEVFVPWRKHQLATSAEGPLLDVPDAVPVESE